jgi:hypothetical protein
MGFRGVVYGWRPSPGLSPYLPRVVFRIRDPDFAFVEESARRCRGSGRTPPVPGTLYCPSTLPVATSPILEADEIFTLIQTILRVMVDGEMAAPFPRTSMKRRF